MLPERYIVTVRCRDYEALFVFADKPTVLDVYGAIQDAGPDLGLDARRSLRACIGEIPLANAKRVIASDLYVGDSGRVVVRRAYHAKHYYAP